MKTEQTEAEMDSTDRLYDRAKQGGNNVGSILQQRARDAAKRSKRQAETNYVRAEMDVRSDANDICNACHNRPHTSLGELVRDGGSKTYRDAIAGFLSAAENVGAIVVTGDDIFVADYELLLASLGRYLS